MLKIFLVFGSSYTSMYAENLFLLTLAFCGLQGRRVSFKNTLIDMTSNVGATSISDGRRSIGFSTDDTESSTYIAMKTLVMEELKAFFRPELLNRIDEMVVFRPLEETQVCFSLTRTLC
jgi:ATP-dependent Clp protease ATP-binding subunit ClpA